MPLKRIYPKGRSKRKDLADILVGTSISSLILKHSIYITAYFHRQNKTNNPINQEKKVMCQKKYLMIKK
jgi:hypothetical protein